MKEFDEHATTIQERYYHNTENQICHLNPFPPLGVPLGGLLQYSGLREKKGYRTILIFT